MTDTLKDLWHSLGVPAGWGAILTLAVLAVAVVLKRALDHAFERQSKKFDEALERQKADLQKALLDRAYLQGLFDRVMDYSIDQSKALRLAYLELFQSEATGSDGEMFVQVVGQADEMVMAPLRANLGLIDEETEHQVLKIHNDLAQLSGKPSPTVIARFWESKNEFYNDVEKVREMVRADRILYRLGLIDHALSGRRETT